MVGIITFFYLLHTLNANGRLKLKENVLIQTYFAIASLENVNYYKKQMMQFIPSSVFQYSLSG